RLPNSDLSQEICKYMITKLSISMPKSLEEFARWRVRTGGYGSISEYFRELVRVDQRFIVAKQEQNRQQKQEDGPRPLASAARHPFDTRY
ncbi:MAG TPA: hypothetical protein VGQ55_09915, partial [Pyrinomonadaceae bacterium]|nr:hypothetical protein [Pyrinomonadaceae bacterium]